MKTFGKILGGLLVVFIILCLVVPQEFRLEREILIDKPLNYTFMKILFLKNHEQWSHYSLKDPNIQKSYRGQDGTEGYTASWVSQDEEVGTGEQEIIHIYNEKIVNTEIRLEKPFKAKFESYFTTAPEGDKQTKVVMGMFSKVAMPMNVFSYTYNVLLGNQKKIAANIEESLAQMKSVIEEEKAPATVENHKKEIQPRTRR
ncbi:MAG: SRPBCC family protein [Bdellovibrionaceae bacterium]|nr:SRPBCC family protein [Pseudobdellovibrionaceae bacterium]